MRLIPKLFGQPSAELNKTMKIGVVQSSDGRSVISGIFGESSFLPLDRDLFVNFYFMLSFLEIGHYWSVFLDSWIVFRLFAGLGERKHDVWS